MKLRFILSEVGKGLARNRAMSVAVIIVTYVSLLFVGVAGLSQMQVMQMKSQWYDKIEVSIYMCATDDATPSCNATEATEAQISAVRDKLNSAEMSQYVKNVFEESKEEAYENYLKLYGDSTISEWTTVDMMPVSFRVKLVDPEQYSIIKEEFSGAAGVSQVKDQREIIEPLFNVIDAARLMALGLGGVMIIAAILLISTTIRLSAMSRETETQIMRYVGASNLFIQAPFMIEGALAAIAGAILAVGTLFAGVHFLVQGWLAPSFSWTSFIGATHVWIMTPILILAAVALALIASAVSLAKYTKV
ncbi:permease-like cell division protein FtsX [Schaalia turicensis]|uniref:permease-like cell division protein FtsX n=1 Tax=Schaalia turicensis TaxID=131111 RepID=UPI003FA48C3D